MAASYPSGFDSMSDPAANLSGPPLHSTMHNQLNDVVEAIEAELGLNPSGADATVAATLAALAARVKGVHSLTTAFVTTGTHTTYQDEGLTLTIAETISRRYRFTLLLAPYVSGGTNSVAYQLLRGAAVVHEWFLPAEALSASLPHMMPLVHTEVIAATAGASVYKVQFKANTSNTAANSYGAANSPRQLIIEDIGV